MPIRGLFFQNKRHNLQNNNELYKHHYKKYDGSSPQKDDNFDDECPQKSWKGYWSAGWEISYLVYWNKNPVAIVCIGGKKILYHSIALMFNKRINPQNTPALEVLLP